MTVTYHLRMLVIFTELSFNLTRSDHKDHGLYVVVK